MKNERIHGTLKNLGDFSEVSESRIECNVRSIVLSVKLFVIQCGDRFSSVSKANFPSLLVLWCLNK